MSDGPHGLRVQNENGDNGVTGSEPATAFPTAALTACGWNEENLYKMGKAIGEEARYYGIDVVLGPGTNIKRNPLAGRNFEYFSEDPILSGMLAAAMVRGIQQGGTAACVKHFLANNREENRFSYSSEMDDRTLRDLYARVFEITIREGKPKVLMTAYNRFRGTHCAENEYLYNLLRKDLGFGGVVVSDWGGVDYRVKAVRAGMDIDMPGSGKKTNEEVVAAVESGELQEETIDERAAKVVKLLEECRSGKKRVETHITMRQAVADSVVLLKNDGALPLSENAD
ncbi:MAG TPA: glycosyl hydrolase, partial [Firmicutes bacterium]|nr:glycosyl hydrolase [Bacillota bacterium]